MEHVGYAIKLEATYQRDTTPGPGARVRFGISRRTWYAFTFGW